MVSSTRPTASSRSTSEGPRRSRREFPWMRSFILFHEPGFDARPFDATSEQAHQARAAGCPRLVLGAHIYIRPSGQHNLTVLDDLAQESVDRLSADGFEPCAVVETSPGNFQAWLKHHRTYETAVSTFIAQELARRYQADPSAADWRRFGRLPGFTNCKPKHRQANGLFPFVLLRSCSGKPFTLAESFGLEATSRYQLHQEQNRRVIEHRLEQQKRFPHIGAR